MFSQNLSFPKIEEIILEYWRKTRAFEKCDELAADRPLYVFYDGPPFATGLPHYGHILSGAIKDIVGRFMYQQGFKVPRRFGWDCHGLPVEYEVDKRLGITSRKQVYEMGVDAYNRECEAIVMKYSSEWEEVVARMGRWVDFKNGYKTMDFSFMESTWFVFSQLFHRGKIYRGFRVMPFSTACKTPLSNFEASQNYKDVSDPSVLIAFPLLKPLLVGGKELCGGRTVEMVAWTTTPWTLPANCALIVNPTLGYAVFNHQGRLLVAHSARGAEYFAGATVVATLAGADLVGLEYRQPFDYYESLRAEGYFRVLGDSFVSDTNGTAIVHTAPAFGEEDHRVCVENGLLTENGAAPCPVDENGCFTLPPYEGVYVKDADKAILKDLGSKVLLNERKVHNYPFCWRSDTPLIYRLVPNWFVRVKEARAEMQRNNEEINWVPADIKHKRFHNWLAQARDWAVGRNRFWGTPVPIWKSEEEDDYICVGSVAELERLSGRKVTNLHRQFIDDIVIEKDGKKYHRVEEVLDCWFESGSMPYAQEHWPFEQTDSENYTKELASAKFMDKSGLPADFIGEGLDQTRGWFYTLHVLSTLLFDRPAFKNVICFGIVLAQDGKKMSKRLKNYPDPMDVISKHGADALRIYLVSSPVVSAENLRFNERGVMEINKILLIPWYNSLMFCMDCDHAGEHSSTPMDAWITASFDTFCAGVSAVANAMHLNQVLDYALRFVDDLSNWYIRINRKALRKDPTVLERLLRDFSIVMAPFAPFFSEYCFQSLAERRGRPEADGVAVESVHHCLYPQTKPVYHPFEEARQVIMGIRQMRENASIRVKRPLRHATVVCSGALQSKIAEYVPLIQAECNLLELSFADVNEFSFVSTVKPCFEALKRDKETMVAKMGAIRAFSQSQIDELFEKKELVVSVARKASEDLTGRLSALGTDDEVKITIEDVIIERRLKGVENSLTFPDFSLILDLSIDEEIVERTVAREFYSFLQKFRKASGLHLGDSVVVSVENGYVQQAVQKYYADVVFGEGKEEIANARYAHDDEGFVVKLFKGEKLVS